MSVTGYLSLYTTLIGWQQYQHLWSIMVGTGLVFIPFIGIVLDCFLEPFESQEPKNAAVITMRRLMIRIVGALLVIEFCCVPAVSLNPKVLHFEPACTQARHVATPGHSGTTYDNKFPVPTNVKVPLLWYLVMAVSNGFTHAAIKSFPCSPINYRQLQSQLDLTAITDPSLKKETIDFYNDCYIPAYSKYLSQNFSKQQRVNLMRYEQRYGKEDLGWIGSQTFLKTSGFYNQLSAHEPVEGFVFDSHRDQFEGQVQDHSSWGEPTCFAWWSDPDQGLQSKLVHILPANFLSAMHYSGTDPHAVMNSGIRHLIRHSFDSGMSLGEISRGYESLDQDRGGHWISRWFGGKAGVLMEGMHFYPKLYLLINALPVMQALLLMAIYALMALMIPFSSYRLHFIITGSAILFAITFWSYLWHFVLYLDNQLIPALYPTDLGPGLKNALVSWLADGNINAKFLDFIIGTLYIALPILFLILMSWAGLKVSSSIMGAMSGMEQTIDSAASKSADLGRKSVSILSGVIKKNSGH